jgi:hypothetical protein
MTRVGRTCLFLALAAIAAIAGLTRPAPSFATGVPPIDTLWSTSGSDYSPTNAQKVWDILRARQMTGVVGSDGATIGDFLDGLGTAQEDRIFGQVIESAVRTGTVPRLAAAAGATELFLPLATLGAVAVGGYIIWKMTRTDGTSAYIPFKTSRLGGSVVVQPSVMHYGSKLRKASWQYETSGVNAGTYAFQQKYDICRNVTGTIQCGTGEGSSATYIYGFFHVNNDPDGFTGPCVASPTSCYGSGAAYGNADYNDVIAAGSALTQTQIALNGVNTPLKATRVDLNLPGNNLGSGGVACTITVGAADCWAVRTPTIEQAGTAVTTADPAPGAQHVVTTGQPVPAATPPTTSTLDPMKPVTDGDACFRAFINHYLDAAHYDYGGCTTASPTAPGSTDAPLTTFTLPQPRINETYATYLQRLRDLGYVGTAIEHTLDGAHAQPERGPSAVVEVQRNRTTIYQATDWPSPAPTIGLGDGLDIWRNPGDGGPSDPNPPPGGDGGGGSSIDLTPLEDIDIGCKFPFGLLCYAKDVTEWFNVTPTAPSWTLTVPLVTVAGHGYGPWTYGPVDLAYLDTYMGWIRALIALVIGIGTAYYLAGKLFGFEAGDVGAASDAAIHDHTDWH